MHVGVMKLTFRLAENHSLKGKRQVIKSIISRLRNQFDVSVAEVDDNDKWQSSVIGVCCISNDSTVISGVFSNILNFIEDACFDAELLDTETEIVNW